MQCDKGCGGQMMPYPVYCSSDEPVFVKSTIMLWDATRGYVQQRCNISETVLLKIPIRHMGLVTRDERRYTVMTVESKKLPLPRIDLGVVARANVIEVQSPSRVFRRLE